MDIDFEVLERISQQLAAIDIEHVFVGGSVVGLYATENQHYSFRPTDDVDIVLDSKGFRKAEQELEASGFRHQPEDGIICRRVFEGVPVDLMPVDARHFGFTNEWYETAIQSAYIHLVGSRSIPIPGPIEFLATKLAAALDRGATDFRSSHDLEDVIGIVNARRSLEQELADHSNGDLKEYVQRTFSFFTQLKNWETEVVPAFLSEGERIRLPVILLRIESMSQDG